MGFSHPPQKPLGRVSPPSSSPSNRASRQEPLFFFTGTEISLQLPASPPPPNSFRPARRGVPTAPYACPTIHNHSMGNCNKQAIFKHEFFPKNQPSSRSASAVAAAELRNFSHRAYRSIRHKPVHPVRNNRQDSPQESENSEEERRVACDEPRERKIRESRARGVTNRRIHGYLYRKTIPFARIFLQFGPFCADRPPFLMHRRTFLFTWPAETII